MRTLHCFFLLSAWLIHAFPVLAQADAKGVKPLSGAEQVQAGTIRAVVIGISNYQDSGIPDLRFADKDAHEFAAWLKSAAGGSIPEDNIVLLTNENATNAAIGIHLFELIDQLKAGDRAIIYFSGHGDVVTKTIRQPGYLLSYDTPAATYMGSAIPLGDVQDIVSTLTDKLNVQVLLIADACHAGKLAGSANDGVQLTGANLAKQFAGENKILSCQQNEYSLEGEQWEGGRGVFSSILLKGLTGLADKDTDGLVSLREIDNYISEEVYRQTGGLQTPFTLGNRNSIVAKVDVRTLERLRQKEKEQGSGLQVITQKGLEDDVLAKADSATRRQYLAFKGALAAGQLLEPAGHSAWELFQPLSSNTQISPLLQIMRHNLAVALLDEVQQALNALMTDDPYEINQWRFNADKYSSYPLLVQHAIELLGREHPLYHTLEAKRLFFEAYAIAHYPYGFSGDERPDSFKQKARQRLYVALLHDTLAPYVYYLLGNTYLGTFQEDSMRYYFNKALELSPAWTLPQLEMTWDYMDTYWNFEEAGKHIRRAIELRPNAYQPLEMLAWWYQRYERVDSVEAVCRRMRDKRPDLPNDYLTLALTYGRDIRDFDKALYYTDKWIEMDSLQHFFKSEVLFYSRRIKEAFKEMALVQSLSEGYRNYVLFRFYKNNQEWRMADSLLRWSYPTIGSKSDRASTLAALGRAELELGYLDSADSLLHTALSMVKPPAVAYTIAYSSLALLAQKRGRSEAAEAWFRKGAALSPALWTFQTREDGAELFALYGDFLAEQHRLAKAEEKCRKSMDIHPGHYFGYYSMARLKAREGKSKEALDWLEKALARYYPIPKPILDEPLFRKIRKTKRFKAMMAKHFPELYTH